MDEREFKQTRNQDMLNQVGNSRTLDQNQDLIGTMLIEYGTISSQISSCLRLSAVLVFILFRVLDVVL
jgi:hypothetical protein